MTDGHDTVPALPLQGSAPDSLSASATVAYTRIYEQQHPRLVAYARSLTRNAWTAEDLVAEAHFRVWRRLSAGHEIENVPAYLMTTVRHLAAAAGSSSARETPQDLTTVERIESSAGAGAGAGLQGGNSADPAEQVSSVDLLVRVLGQLPERWVRALWLAEAEGQPLETVGERIGAKQGATAVLLHRAREGMRQAFLREQPGAPIDPACQVRWGRMPAYVRGTATPRQCGQLLSHVDECDDCRGRLAVLMRTNDRLPAFVGPALLVFVVGGGAGRLLAWLTAGSTGVTGAAGAAGGTGVSGTAGASGAGGAVGASGAVGGHGGGQLLDAVRQMVSGGAKVKPGTAAVSAAVAAAAVAVGIGLGSLDPAMVPPQRTPVAQAPTLRLPEAPVADVPEHQAARTDGRAEPRQTDPGRTAAGPVAPADVRTDDGGSVVIRARDEDGNGSVESPSVETPADEDTTPPDETTPREETPPKQETPPYETPPDTDGPSNGGEGKDEEPGNGDDPGHGDGDTPGNDSGDTPGNGDGDTPGNGHEEQPGAEEPGAEQPGGETPGAEEPGGGDPGSEEPGTETPGGEEPGSGHPGTEAPGVETPGTDSPGTEAPGGDSPGTGTPGTGTPGTGTPGTDNPGSGTPGGDSPGAEAPGTDTPAPEEPTAPGAEEPGPTEPPAHQPAPGGPGGDC